MAEPDHYVVIEALDSNGSSDYAIQATGEIEMVDGRLGGVDVSRDSDAPATGSDQRGTVWAGADGYRVYGGIKHIDIENPDHVQLHTGKISGGQRGEECEVTIRAREVEFVSGQGAGEGALELTINHDVHGAQSERETLRLPTNSRKRLGTAIDNIKVPQGGSVEKRLTTMITEREVPADWFVGNDDYGQASMPVTLECGETKEVSQTVNIGSDRGNTGKVKVHYTVGDLSS